MSRFWSGLGGVWLGAYDTYTGRVGRSTSQIMRITSPVSTIHHRELQDCLNQVDSTGYLETSRMDEDWCLRGVFPDNPIASFQGLQHLASDESTFHARYQPKLCEYKAVHMTDWSPYFILPWFGPLLHRFTSTTPHSRSFIKKSSYIDGSADVARMTSISLKTIAAALPISIIAKPLPAHARSP